MVTRLEAGTFYTLAEVTFTGTGWQPICRADPRRVALIVGYQTGEYIWPTPIQSLTQVGYNLQALPCCRVTLHDDGPIVASEWWCTVNAVSGVALIEILLERGSVYALAEEPVPGRKCWRYRGGRWEPYAGSIPGPGANNLDGQPGPADYRHLGELIRGSELGPDVSLLFPRANEPTDPLT